MAIFDAIAFLILKVLVLVSILTGISMLSYHVDGIGLSIAEISTISLLVLVLFKPSRD